MANDLPARERHLIEAVRHACLDAAQAAYEDASMRGLCHEGAWEAAISGIRMADLGGIGARAPGEGDAQAGLDQLHPVLVADVMTSDLVTFDPNDELVIAEDVMRLGRIRHLPVVDPAGRLAGIVSQRDLLRRALLQDGQQRAGRPASPSTARTIRVRDVMTTEVVVTAPDAPLRDAADRMFRLKLGCLPVVVHDRLVGILTESDFVRVVL